jgi:hypothetical protein
MEFDPQQIIPPGTTHYDHNDARIRNAQKLKVEARRDETTIDAAHRTQFALGVPVLHQ